MLATKENPEDRLIFLERLRNKLKELLFFTKYIKQRPQEHKLEDSPEPEPEKKKMSTEFSSLNNSVILPKNCSYIGEEESKLSFCSFRLNSEILGRKTKDIKISKYFWTPRFMGGGFGYAD